MKISLPYIIIGALLIIILIMRTCQPSPEPQKPTIVTKIDTVFVEKQIEKLVYVPGPIKFIPGKTEYKDVDTTAILADYFGKRVYRDSVNIDTIGYVVINDTISENRILSRETFGVYNFPTITKTITTTLPPIYKAKFFIGFDLEGNKVQPISYFGPNATLVTKKDKLYSIGVGYGPSQQLNYKFGMGFKIGKRK